jgi:hypothetical protein
MAGLILILVPTIQYGGLFLLKSLLDHGSRYTDNAVREDLMRAGHAHAGVIVLLSLIVQILADHATLPAMLLWLVRIGVPVSAMLLSAGFFLSMPSVDLTQANGMISLVYLGAGLLALSVVVLAVGLLRAPKK